MDLIDRSPGQLARQIPGATRLFDARHLDFCCGGSHSLRSAAAKEQVHGAALRRLEELTDGVTPPRAACTTRRALYAGLRTFRQALVPHIHTENNILFERFAPAAVV
jgi:regulator of cell morphogenesis and NO signaling